MRNIKAFIKGIQEFRMDSTTSYNDYAELSAYDWGREMAHRVTLRRFETV